MRDGRILCAGTLEECQAWGEATVDDRVRQPCSDPRFAEAHGHTMDSASELAPYVGYFPYPVGWHQHHRDPQLRGVDRPAEGGGTPGSCPPEIRWWPTVSTRIYFPDLPRLSKREPDQSPPPARSSCAMPAVTWRR